MATFKELTGLDPLAPFERPLDTIHQSGADTRRAASDKQIELDENTSVAETFGAAWDRGLTATLYDDVERKWKHEAEEGFDPTAWVTENKETLPGQNLEKFKTVRSTAEANELRNDMIAAEDNEAIIAAKGYAGMAAQLLTGLVDPAELALAIGTGGLGKAATTIGRIGQAAKVGTRGAIASGTAYNAVDPLADTKQVVMATLTGAILSTGMSTAANGFNRSAKATRDNYAAEVDDLEPATRTQSSTPVYENLRDMEAEPVTDEGQSLSAGRITQPLKSLPLDNPRSKDIYDQSVKFLDDNDIPYRSQATDMNTSTSLGRTAKRFSDALAKGKYMYEGAKTDFDRLMYGGSHIESALAYNLLESAEGRVRNNRSGAMLKETYEQRLSSHSLPALDDSFDGWAKAKGMGLQDRHRPSTRDAFNREVIEELEARFHEGAPVSDNVHVTAAADGVDANYKDALEIGKGRDGETSVSGFEDLQAKSGFFNHKWSGSGVRRAMSNGHSKTKIINLLAKGYGRSYPNMKPAYRTMVAKAVVRRAMAKEEGVDTNMLNTLDSDAQTYLRELLTDSGQSVQDIDRLIDSIRGKKQEQGKLATTKQRVQVDLRTSDGDLSLMDLVDTNLTRVLSSYNREISGNAALARKGIPDKTARKDMIEAAMAERRERGLTADDKQREFLENIFTYFDSGPISGGVDPMVARAKRVTNLALLNQMGMTQAGETGAQIAAVGMSTWKKHAKSVYAEMRKQGPAGPIANELRPWMGRIGEEHLLFRDDLMLDELSVTKDLNTFLGKLDFALGKGQRLQGYASGFYKVREFQQKVSVMSMADKVMQRLRDGVDEAALADIGISSKIGKYVKDGTVTFDADGFVDQLNMRDWNPTDAEDFALSLNRHTHQVVQKAMAGEENVWMHKTVGSVYMHLKSFPLTAMRKQSARLAGVSTPAATVALLMGLATAGLAFEARQLINGRTDRLSGGDALKGAMGMSNMTGWIPMLTDPAFAIVGMNQLRFNQYGRHDISTGIIATPPVIPTLNRMAQAPGAVNPFSDLSANERIRIMQATPIVGNLYGFSLLFNSMK